MNAKNGFGTRLRAAMKAVGLKPSGTVLANAFNRKWDKKPIAMQTAAHWINGVHLPGSDRLRVLAKLLRVDPHALLYGAPEPVSAADRRREWEDKVNYAERETIDAFLRLPTTQRLLVRDVIATYAKVYGAVDPGKE